MVEIVDGECALVTPLVDVEVEGSRLPVDCDIVNVATTLVESIGLEEVVLLLALVERSDVVDVISMALLVDCEPDVLGTKLLDEERSVVICNPVVDTASLLELEELVDVVVPSLLVVCTVVLSDVLVTGEDSVLLNVLLKVVE